MFNAIVTIMVIPAIIGSTVAWINTRTMIAKPGNNQEGTGDFRTTEKNLTHTVLG